MAYHSAFKITVPEGYKAVSGYVQHVAPDFLVDQPGVTLEILVGDHQRVRLVSPRRTRTSVPSSRCRERPGRSR